MLNFFSVIRILKGLLAYSRVKWRQRVRILELKAAAEKFRGVCHSYSAQTSEEWVP